MSLKQVASSVLHIEERNAVLAFRFTFCFLVLSCLRVKRIFDDTNLMPFVCISFPSLFPQQTCLQVGDMLAKFVRKTQQYCFIVSLKIGMKIK